MKYVTNNQIRKYFQNRPISLPQAYKNMRRKGFSRKQILDNFECGVLCSNVLNKFRKLDFDTDGNKPFITL